MNEITINYNFDMPEGFEEVSAEQIVRLIFDNENLQISDINIVFVNDDYLKELHSKYLNKPQNTDVITFDLSENEDQISGEIYISVERAEDQALEYKVTIMQELYRYLIHGALHLCGYDDIEESDRRIMKNKEEEYLLILSKLN